MDVEARYLSEPGPLGLFTRITRVGLLVDAFQHRSLDPLGLLFIDYSVLRLLQLAGAPYQMSPTELSEVVLRSSGGMTQILDRLESAGLVARSADPSDRRKVVVGLTSDGLQKAERANTSYRRARERLLGALTAEEIAQLDSAVHRLLDVLSEDGHVRARA
ncbi:MAG: MarR family winged helix-turn-helix transcriptional regulator [Acidimicrobiia bacterium]